jgi:hypothetical protein
MSGLFTLNDDPLGKLDQGVLGGFGTGFIVGQSTTSGTVSGAQGFTGSVAGQSTSAGSASGFLGLAGSASGSSTTSGAANGAPLLSGFVNGSSLSSGTAIGTEGNTGSVTGASVSTGSAQGAPQLSGAADGASASSGTATGSPDVPPEPPTPPAPTPQQPEGFARWLWDNQPIRRPQPAPQPIPPKHATGGARGRSRATGNTVGTCGYAGAARGAVSVTGRCIGVRYPSDELVARWARQAMEHELLTIGVVVTEKRELPDNYRPALEDDVPEGRACGNCMFYDETNTNGDRAWCQQWNEYVRGDYYCNAWQADERTTVSDLEYRTFSADMTDVRAIEGGTGMQFGGWAWALRRAVFALAIH